MDLMPQLIPAIVPGISSLVITWIAKSAANRLKNVATKDFVEEKLAESRAKLAADFGQAFIHVDTQRGLNESMLNRLNRLEDWLFRPSQSTPTPNPTLNAPPR